MKRKTLFLILSAFITFSIQAQDKSFWPDEVKYIPDIDREIYTLDRSHSKLSFAIGFFGFSDVEGTFDRWWSTVLYNEEDLRKTSITLVIDASTISTGSNTRDKDLNKENFFDTENHKYITFETKRVEKRGKKYVAIGDLTMRGVTKELSIPFERTQGRFIDPFWSNLNIGFKGELTLNRMDFGIHGGRWGEKVLSDEVKIGFAIVAKQPNTFKWGPRGFSTKTTELVEMIQAGGVSAAKDKFVALIQGNEDQAMAVTLPVKRLMQKNYFKEAVELSEFILEKYPEHRPSVTRDLAKAHLYLGNKEKALELYSLIKEMRPTDTEALEVLKHLK